MDYFTNVTSDGKIPHRTFRPSRSCYLSSGPTTRHSRPRRTNRTYGPNGVVGTVEVVTGSHCRPVRLDSRRPFVKVPLFVLSLVKRDPLPLGPFCPLTTLVPSFPFSPWGSEGCRRYRTTTGWRLKVVLGSEVVEMWGDEGPDIDRGVGSEILGRRFSPCHYGVEIPSSSQLTPKEMGLGFENTGPTHTLHGNDPTSVRVDPRVVGIEETY